MYTKGSNPSAYIHLHEIPPNILECALGFTARNKFNIFDWIDIVIYTKYLLHHREQCKEVFDICFLFEEQAYLINFSDGRYQKQYSFLLVL